jgi:pimeloyl-ACP methyl ester carboxylesterase
VRSRIAITAAGLAVAVLATACTPSARWEGSNPKSSPPAASAGGITWQSCAADAHKINSSLPRTLVIECGTVKVPQDWATAKDGKPADGKTFDIALMRIRADKQTQRIGSLLTNPGGPGGSGIDFLPYLAGRVPGLLTRFDLIGFDPRGVGKSDPVECMSDEDLDANFGYDPDPVSDQAFQGAVALSRTLANGCSTKYGDALRLFSTEQTARDMDAIRAALGDTKLNYLGFSYGTLLGAVYAELFPKTIRAMVLDGAVDPQQGPIPASEGQAKGFERAFSNFTTWCKQQGGSTCPINADPRGAVVSAIDAARTAPVSGAGGRKATSGWVFTAVVSSLYAQEAWPYLAQGIAALRNGDPRIIFLLADSYAERDAQGHYSNLFDANNAVNCADSKDYPSVDKIRTLQSQWRAAYPLFGPPLALGMLTCTLWPAKKDPYPVGPAKGSPPLVVVGTTGDPATPYESTQKLANMLGTATVVTWQGEGHTAYPETACIRVAIDKYLTDLAVPAKGLTCPAR